MTESEYDGWSKRYAATFGLAAEADAAMLVAWFEVFVALDYDAAELNAARLVVAASPPKFRTEHLAAIHAAVRERRANQRVTDGPAEGEVGECTLCGNTGSVVVPHPGYVVAGEWVAGDMGYRPTAGVLCSCWAGRRIADKYPARPAHYRERIKRPMELAEYQKRVPQWKDILAAHEAAVVAACRAAAFTETADKAGPLAAAVNGVVAGAMNGAPAPYEPEGDEVPF